MKKSGKAKNIIIVILSLIIIGEIGLIIFDKKDANIPTDDNHENNSSEKFHSTDFAYAYSTSDELEYINDKVTILENKEMFDEFVETYEIFDDFNGNKPFEKDNDKYLVVSLTYNDCSEDVSFKGVNDKVVTFDSKGKCGNCASITRVYFINIGNSTYSLDDYSIEYNYLIGEKCEHFDMVKKPVLYLYPENDNTKVSVNFAKSELLTTTYPLYENGWSVIANKNGDLHDNNGKYYYALYWEENYNPIDDFKEGFFVTKDNAIEFLEEKLTIIGLNDKERNEFIMYWLPVLEQNENSLVYFELTDSKQKYNELIIDPKPDSLLRLTIHVKKVDKKQDIKEQQLQSFARNGFTAVEWGGINY